MRACVQMYTHVDEERKQLQEHKHESFIERPQNVFKLIDQSRRLLGAISLETSRFFRVLLVFSLGIVV